MVVRRGGRTWLGPKNQLFVTYPTPERIIHHAPSFIHHLKELSVTYQTPERIFRHCTVIYPSPEKIIRHLSNTRQKTRKIIMYPFVEKSPIIFSERNEKDFSVPSFLQEIAHSLEQERILCTCPKAHIFLAL